jgi:hypothetical protein
MNNPSAAASPAFSRLRAMHGAVWLALLASVPRSHRDLAIGVLSDITRPEAQVLDDGIDAELQARILIACLASTGSVTLGAIPIYSNLYGGSLNPTDFREGMATLFGATTCTLEEAARIIEVNDAGDGLTANRMCAELIGRDMGKWATAVGRDLFV